MNNFIEWFDMNGYAGWVWSAYALWALAFAWLVIGTMMGRQRALRRLQDRQRRVALKTEQSNQQDGTESVS